MNKVMQFLKNLLGPNEAEKKQLSRATEQLLQLEVDKKRLEMEKQQISLVLENASKKNQMALENVAHKEKLRLEEERSKFVREKSSWEAERKELEERSKREVTELTERLRKEMEIKLTEAVSLVKLESQQKIAQAELDKDRTVNELKTQQSEAIAKIRSESAEEHYEKLTSAFQRMQLDGDKNTKFVQEMALKILDKTPVATTHTTVDVSTPALEAPKGKR